MFDLQKRPSRQHTQLTRPAPRERTAPASAGAQRSTASPGWGNQAAQRFAQSCPLNAPGPSLCPFGGVCHSCPVRAQTKLRINKPGDKYEQEADRVAEQVLRMPDPRTTSAISEQRPHIQRACADCEEELQRQVDEEEEEEVQAKEAPGRVPRLTADIDSRIRALRGGGRPLSGTERAFFEPRFGHDFGGVRLHTGGSAAAATRVLQARAFTLGGEVFFGSAQYAPETPRGKRLLAHELTHVVQQTKGSDPAKDAIQASCVPSETIQLQPTRRSGLGKKKATPGCAAPACFPGSSGIFRFKFDSDELLSGEEERLKHFIRLLHPSGSVTILGFASVEGPAEYNSSLACHRANRIRKIIQAEGATVRSTRAAGETNLFGPELPPNRAAQVIVHEPKLPPLTKPTPRPKPKPIAKLRPKPTRKPVPNCGCPGAWSVSRAIRAPGILGRVKCRCLWICIPSRSTISGRRPPVGGCSGSPVVSSPLPPARRTWGTITGATGGKVEEGGGCLCTRDACMTKVGVAWKKL